ncbi:MAG TPA: alpha-L-arabinofuranosidase C-terminal domain-containing protein [Verrucomicrobiae bacterium]|nr:alpha-L-arabinofuranosidase C-terminal domain-containing protein [Verrucomicrobiae bacterium]
MKFAPPLSMVGTARCAVTARKARGILSPISHLLSSLLFAACLLIIASPSAHAGLVTLTVQAEQPGAKINPAMWGIFFEDINFGADGGLYAELVKNRSFEFPDPLMGWIKISPSLAHGELTIRDDGPFDSNNPHYARIASEGTAPFGISNEGFRGMGVRKGESYDFSAQIRGVAGSPPLLVQLYGGDGTLLDAVKLEKFSTGWQKYTATLHPSDTDPKARLAVVLDGRGTLDIDMISLFPEHTWKNRPGGLRADMVQALADLHPGFLRFPGGCIVEGSVLARRYQWKNTIGPVEDRHLLINRWNYEFQHRPTPDYFQSFGLGFYEYFQLCEDIGAEPLPILNCGMACQFNSGELCPMDQLQPYIQDALDLIEFANGPADSTWGAKRAALGHPEPFHLKMLGVGNEQWGQQYIDRYTKFAKALKAQYPDIQLVAAAGPSPADERFDFAWSKFRVLHADIIDEHCYARPEWFFSNTHRYDDYDRSGPKVFMGEYAAQSDKVVSVKNRNNLECALAEAAYMTGMERNADVVRMASYAPLFANTEAWQWTPDLIWVNSLNVCETPNYYVQQLFSCNRGDEVLPAQLAGIETSDSGIQNLYGSATRDDQAGEIILKVVNPRDEEQKVRIVLADAKDVLSDATEFVLSGPPTAENTMDQPKQISPVESSIRNAGNRFTCAFAPNSFTVLRIKAFEKAVAAAPGIRAQ